MATFQTRLVARRALAGCVAALLVCALGACGSTTTSNSSSACGTLPAQQPQDPDRTLTGVSQTAVAAYDGWPYPLRRSALADWKPKAEGPYTVGVVFNGTGNLFQATAFKAVQEQLRRSPLVGKVLAVATEPGNATKQVQAYQSLVDQGVDLIMLQPASAPAFVARIRAALDRGVATFVIVNVVDDPATVNFAPNVHTSGGGALAHFVNLLGGKGNILGVHGIRASEVDRSTWVSYRQVLALCPDIEVVGEIDGNFAPPAVRAAVLQYLATHPGKIDGVVHTSTMGPAIISAFQQAGRPVPPVTAMGAEKGELAYWAAHAAEGYASAGYAAGSSAMSNAAARIALRLLAGQGPKVNMIPWPRPLITSANLNQYAQPDWTLETPGSVEQAPSTYWSDKDLDSLFHHPDRKAGVP